MTLLGSFLLVIMATQLFFSFFFFNDTATTEIYTLSLHDALPILLPSVSLPNETAAKFADTAAPDPELEPQGRSEEHTSELQSHSDLVCRLLLEKKKKEKQKERAE